VAKPQTSC